MSAPGNLLEAINEISGLAIEFMTRARADILVGGARSVLSAGEQHLLIDSKLRIRRLERLKDGSKGRKARRPTGALELISAWREAIRR
jgi:hypothetical protein